jgi:peptide/nickel transport system substrate-binding protein
MFHLMRRSAIVSKLALSAVALTALASPVLAADKTITAVMHSDLRIIDPLFTTAYIARDHGYMVYDTLLATDSNFKIQPQMADWKVSDDKLTYTFTLRDGLKWHDGTPVTAEDCVASLKRWGRVDNMGQKLMDFTASIEATDPKTITLRLKEPYGLVLESIGKPSSYVPFMMPKRMAETPAGQQMKEQIGSGPFKFVAAEFQPGVKAVYEKNTDYVPRKEPPNWTSGGKVVKVDRVEWITMPDAQTAVNALQSGDIDFMENLPYDMLPLLEEQGAHDRGLEQVRFPDARTDELSLPAVRQRKGAPCCLAGDEPEGRARRARRQPQISKDLRCVLRVRNAARDRCRGRDPGEGQWHGGGEEAARRVRL